MDRLNEEVTVPCPNNECSHFLTHKAVFNYIGAKNFEEVNEQYTNLYIDNTDDWRRCPSKGCAYAGSIETKPCSDDLECNKWGFTWREYEQMSTCQKMIRNVKNLFNWESETLSYMNEVVTGSQCPQWGITILKEDGWKHMICQKCKYEFCWIWLGHYPGYKHTENTFCPIRKLITYLSLAIGFIAIYFKLIISFSFLSILQSLILSIMYYPFYYFLFPNFILFSLIFVGPISGLPAALILERNKITENPILSIMIIAIGVSVGWFILCSPFLYIYMWYKIICSSYYFFIAKTIFYEVVIILTVVLAIYLGKILYNLCYGFVSMISGKIVKVKNMTTELEVNNVRKRRKQKVG